MNALHRILRGAASASTPAPPVYVSQYSCAAGTEPRAADVARFPGLLVVHEIRPSSSGAIRLVAYWSTRDHFDRDGKSLANELSAARADSHGFVANPQLPREPFWKRIRLHTALLSVAAVIGAVQVITGTYNWLFVRPDLELKVTATKYSAVENQQF